MINIAVIGFGVVGSGTVRLLDENSEIIKKRVGDEVRVKYIVDLRDFPDSPYKDRIIKDFNTVLADDEVSVVAELIGGSHPAYDFSMAALRAGKSVVTSNKEVVANFGDELIAEAKKNNVKYLFEASVGGGIPVLRPLSADLADNEIIRIDGILNGTTNYILTKMFSSGADMATALKEAQEKGYAEANPSADIDGLDACRKICILAALAYGKLLPIDRIQTEGITKIRLADVKNADKIGCAIKLIGSTAKIGDKVFAAVRPALVSYDSPLSHISNVYNGIMIRGNFSGDLMFYGSGAGTRPTASAVAADIVNIAAGTCGVAVPSPWARATDTDIADSDRVCAGFYVSLAADEEKLPQVRAAFGDINLINTADGEIAFAIGETKESTVDNAAKKAGFTLLSKIEML